MGALARVQNMLARLPGRCQVCALPLATADDTPLCPACARLLAPRTGGYCPSCGICYADPESPVYPCLPCRTAAPPWTALAFHGLYVGLLREVVHGHKFGHDHGLGRVLRYVAGLAWAEHGLDRPDCIVPVPMTTPRLFERGFNQSLELARLLVADLGVPLVARELRKTRETRTQSSLGRAARQNNVAGAYAAGCGLASKHVLLVDDVMTTGATLTACAAACLAAGAARVDVFVLARAV